MRALVSASAAALLGAGAAGAQDAAGAHGADGKPYEAMLESFCMDCHNFTDWAGGVAFDTLDVEDVAMDADIWEEAARRLRGRLMPPPGSPQPDQEFIDGFVQWMEARLDEAAPAHGPGHVPIHRLNRTEYAVAVKGLLDVDVRAEDILPQEIEVDGFDNMASALSVSPAFLDQYIAASRAVARLAVGQAGARLAIAHYPAPGGAQTTYQDGMPLGTRGGMSFTHQFPADGEYRINILDLDAGLYPRGLETEHTVVVLVAGREVFRDTIGGLEDLALYDREAQVGADKIMERFSDISVHVPAGPHEVIVTFIERSRAETDDNNAGGGFGFGRVPRVLDGIEISGPYETTGMSRTSSRDRIFVCEPDAPSEERACAERIAESLARRAYRRPAGADDVARLMPFYEIGAGIGGFETGVEHLVAAVLASPDFLYRTITPPEEDAPAYALNDLELASRLAFFLWSQGPDEALIEAASDGSLRDPAVMEAQVLRMLDDRRARTLVNNFALRWLRVHDLDVVEVDPARFPGFSAAMRGNFDTEMQLFLSSILLEDRSVLDLLTADHTYVNEALARHYGMDGVRGPQFRRVTLQEEARYGLLGKGSVLLRTSYGDRTSPVLRGAWVLEKLMGTPPAPPPPGVETDLSIQEGEAPLTIRARLEEHRADPSCSGCHGVIDPIGLALENFDVTGIWRDVDVFAGQPIDASTVMPNGAAIDGPAELREELMRRPDYFVRAFAEKLMMYALGREVEYHDMPQLRRIVRDAEADDYRLSALVLGIVNSDAFRMQGVSEHVQEAALAP